MNLLSTVITSVPDRENVVFEIWMGVVQLAEVSHEPGKPIEIEIYSPEGEKWSFELEELMAILNEAVQNLNYS